LTIATFEDHVSVSPARS